MEENAVGLADNEGQGEDAGDLASIPVALPRWTPPPLPRSLTAPTRVASKHNVASAAWLSTPWIEPSVEAAREFYLTQLYERGQLPIWSTTVQQMSDLGVGIVLHLRLLRSLSCLFLALTVLALPIFAVCVAGNALSNDEMDMLRVTALSIANVGEKASPESYVLVIRWPWPGWQPLQLDASRVSLVIAVSDAAVTLAFLIAALLLSRSTISVADEVDANVITAADYAVYVQGLPRDATEAEVSV